MQGRKRSLVMTLTGTLLAAMVLFPPWRWSFDGLEGSAGYAFLFASPQLANSIDYGRLALQVVAVLLIGGVLAALGNRYSAQRNAQRNVYDSNQTMDQT